MKQFQIIVIFLIHPFFSNAQLQGFSINPIQTDSNMDPNAPVHRVYLNNQIPTKDALFVFLPGTNGLPEMYDEIAITAANLGYHAISLSYPNYLSISETCKFSTDPNCSENARLEVITGDDLHPEIEVNKSNSIENRLLKLLHYLAEVAPNKGWQHYYDVEGLRWEKIGFGGHSQGGGHAALLGKYHTVERVLFFNSPSDFNVNYGFPSWISTDHLTSSNRYFAFFHWQNGGTNRLEVYEMFGILENGAEENVDLNNPPYNSSHVLFTDSTSFDNSGITNQNGLNEHSDIIVDHELPIDVLGETPYRIVWAYMLSKEITTAVESVDNQLLDDVSIYPNPSTGVFRIETESNLFHKIEILNAAGQLLQELPFSNELSLNLNTGIYFLKFYKEGMSTVKKVVIY